MHLCPEIAPAIVTIPFKCPAVYLWGEEGTTQGDPLAMTMYAIDTVPLIHQPDACILSSVGQVWFVDHATAGGKLSI